MLPTKFRIIWPRGYRREEFFKSVNQKQESPVAAMFVNGSGQMSNLYRGPSFFQFIWLRGFRGILTPERLSR